MVRAVTPIPFVKARFFDRCGKPLAGGKVYTYEANTTTAKTTYKDPYGLTPNTNPIILDAAGEADIYLDGTYRIRITDRNGVLINDVAKIGSWFSDNLQDTLDNISGAMDDAIKPMLQNLDDVINTAAAAGAGANGWGDLLIALENGRTQREKNKDRQSVFDFLTNAELTQWRNNKLTFDWSPVAKRAFDMFKVQNGGKLYFPQQTVPYLFNGIQAPDGKWVGIQIPASQGGEYGNGIAYGLEGECSEVTFQCGRDDMIMVRHSASYSDVKNFTIRPTNVNTNTCIAYAVTPENWVTPDGYASSHNYISNIFIHNMNRGVVLFCGSKGTSAGGCYYNTFLNIHVTGGGRATNGNVSAYELLSPVKNPTDTNLSPANRNVFINCKAFLVNRGIYIQAGDTNRFYGCSLESVNQSGDFETTPTGLRIDKKDPVSNYDNLNNQFFGFITESCTQDAVLNNKYIKIFGHTLDATKCIVTDEVINTPSCTITGGSDASLFPDIYGSQVSIMYNIPKNWDESRRLYGRSDFIAGSQTVFDVDGKQREFDILSTNTTGLNLIKGNRSVVSKYSKFVDLTVVFAFNPAAADSVITIDLPFIANKAVYFGNADSWNSTYNFLFNISATVLKPDNINYTLMPHVAELLANNDGVVDKIRIKPPAGGWRMIGDNSTTGNTIQFHLRYRT